MREGKLHVPDNPILLWIEGDGIGPDIMTASKRIWDAAVQKVYGGQRKICLDGDLRRREGSRPLTAAITSRPRACDALREFVRRHQGPADHAGGRRIPQPERGAAPGARSLRLRPPRQVVSRACPARCATPSRWTS